LYLEPLKELNYDFFAPIKPKVSKMSIKNNVPYSDQHLAGPLVIMAAVKRLFPEIKLIGPGREDGEFYYEFFVQNPLSKAELNDVQKVVVQLLEENPQIVSSQVREEEALILLSQEPLKLKKISAEKPFSRIYFQLWQVGEFYDIFWSHDPMQNHNHSIQSIEILKGDIPSQEVGDIAGIRQRIYGIMA
jgi:threonyl-tRNA synthetase